MHAGVARTVPGGDDAAMDAPFHEFDLIHRLQKKATADHRVALGIGDDAAVLSNRGTATLVATDLLLEGRHFRVDDATPEQIGRKALAVNLSDIAAMASRPVAVFVTVAHRRAYGPAFAERVHDGLAELADAFGVVVAGGDTNVWDGPLVIGAAVVGEVVGEQAVSRRGAKPGDRIFVTGPLGGSLSSGRHLTFPPRVREALALHGAVDLHAMIDLSDGLLADLGHISDQSRVAAILNAEAIPVTEAARRHSDDRTPLERALTDGEDFELAFCVSPSDAERLRTAPPDEVSLTEIGEITVGAGVTVLDSNGQSLTFQTAGWKHQW